MAEYHFPQDLLDDVNRDLFLTVTEELMPSERDGVNRRPYTDFVRADLDRLAGGEPFEEAVRAYAALRERIKREREKAREALGPIFSFPVGKENREKLEAWEHDRAFFLLPDPIPAAFQERNTPEFRRFCSDNRVHFILRENKNGEEYFRDLTVDMDFTIECELAPGSADDAATYLEYRLRPFTPGEGFSGSKQEYAGFFEGDLWKT